MEGKQWECLGYFSEYKGESTSGGNEGSFTLFACPKSIDGSHVEKVIIIGLEVNFQLKSFNSRERSKYKGRIILNIMTLLNDSSYFNPSVNEHLLLVKNNSFFPFMTTRVSNKILQDVHCPLRLIYQIISTFVNFCPIYGFQNAL